MLDVPEINGLIFGRVESEFHTPTEVSIHHDSASLLVFHYLRRIISLEKSTLESQSHQAL